jgi:hypothetical protein
MSMTVLHGRDTSIFEATDDAQATPSDLVLLLFSALPTDISSVVHNASIYSLFPARYVPCHGFICSVLLLLFLLQ